MFTLFQTNGTIVHGSGLCLDRADIKSGGNVIVKRCSGADSQKWEFQNYLSVNQSPSVEFHAER